MTVKYKVGFKIHGETDGYIPKHGIMLITFNEDCESNRRAEEKVCTFISEVFNINENRIAILKIRLLKKYD
jgi:hypothetical protein